MLVFFHTLPCSFPSKFIVLNYTCIFVAFLMLLVSEVFYCLGIEKDYLKYEKNKCM